MRNCKRTSVRSYGARRPSKFSIKRRPMTKPKHYKINFVMNFFERFKLVICVVCFFVCAYQLIKFLRVYYSFPTSVDAKVSNELYSRVPAIAMCYNQETLFDTICAINTSFCIDPEEDKNATEELRKVRNQEIMWHVIYGGYMNFSMIRECKLMDTDGIITFVKDCESGWFFTGKDPTAIINADWGNSSLANYSNFIEFIFNVNFELQFLNTSIPRYGAFVFLDSPQNIPTNNVRAFFMEPSTLNKITFKRTTVHRLPPPYDTRCRNYQEDYARVKSQSHISQQTCIYNCIWDQLLILCKNCIPLPLPFVPPIVGCRTKDSGCINKTQFVVIKEECESNCPIGCHTQYFEYMFSKLAKMNMNNSMVYVELRGNVDVSYKHKPQFSSVELFSNVGGYLGVWLGLSVPLMYDIAHRLFLHLFEKISKINSYKTRKDNLEEQNNFGYVLSSLFDSRFLKSH